MGSKTLKLLRPSILNRHFLSGRFSSDASQNRAPLSSEMLAQMTACLSGASDRVVSSAAIREQFRDLVC